jgi:hypothetical protein
MSCPRFRWYRNRRGRRRCSGFVLGTDAAASVELML